jgi:hypothetical protein
MTTFIEPHIAIGRVDGEDVDLDKFVDDFLEWLESCGYECGGFWKVVSDKVDG